MRRDYLQLALLALLIFVPFLGGVHLFDWDEINFAESAREMILTGNYFQPQIDFEPFWEKPPLFIWMQVIAMKWFGVNEFAARLPNALCGMATVLVVYHIGRRLYDRHFAWLWVLAWLGSLLPHLYFRSGIIDPWFNLLIFCGLFGFIEFRWLFFTLKGEKSFFYRYRHLLLGGFLLGLAVLTKGPTAMLIVGLTLVLYWGKYRFKMKGYFMHLVLFFATAIFTAFLWFGADILKNGTWFTYEFIVYQIRLFATPDSGHGGFFGYHVVVLLLGCLPASVFAIPNLWGDNQAEEEMLESSTLDACKRSDFTTFMQILFWVVLILFSLVRTKIVHYSSLAYFPLTYLSALTLWRALHWDIRPRISGFLLPVLGTLLGLVVAAIPFFGMRIKEFTYLFAKDPFAQANIQADVVWHPWQALPGILFIIGIWVGWWLWRRGMVWQSAQFVFGGGVLFASLSMLFLVCNIEGYSQRAAIEFYESKRGEDCFVKNVGFKSFAPLFYSDKQSPGPDKAIDDQENLTRGNPGKKVYFVTKVTYKGNLLELQGCKKLYEKNGFVFYERIPE